MIFLLPTFTLVPNLSNKLSSTYLSAYPYAVFSATAAAVVNIAGAGREEFINREADITENITRLACGIAALLFRYAEIINRYEHLDISNQLYDSE